MNNPTEQCEKQLSDMRLAIHAVVMAEYRFRCGPNAYKGYTQDWFEQSMTNLRKLATGFEDLAKAGESLGVGDKVGKKVVTRLRLKPVQPPERKRLPVADGLFD